MVRYTKKRKVLRKRTRKQRGGLTPEQIAAKAALGSGLAGLFGGPRKQPPPPAAPNAPPAAPNDPLAKYKKMYKFGAKQLAIIEKMKTDGINITTLNINELFPKRKDINDDDEIKKRTGFTLEELNILKGYLDKSIIIEQALKSSVDPHILYSDVSEKEIKKASDEIAKPDLPPKPILVMPARGNGNNPAKAIKNALQIRLLGAVQQDIKFFTELTQPEKNALQAAEKLEDQIRTIINTTIPGNISLIKRKRAENTKISILEIEAILNNLDDIDKLKIKIQNILKPHKEKFEFLDGNPAVKKFKVDEAGPLPNGWFIEVDSQKKTKIYRNKYTNLIQNERPTEEALPPTELPEGWGIGEDETDVWYVNLITNKSQWTIPTEPAQLFDTTGWTQTKNPDGSYVWYMPYNKNNSGKWFVMRNADTTWYENPSNANGVKYNTPPF